MPFKSWPFSKYVSSPGDHLRRKFDPSLVLSPHVFLLGLLFADRAFRRVEGEEVLVSAEQLLHLNIRPECNELRLLLDPTLDDFPVFRQSVSTLQGTAISADKTLPYATLLPHPQSTSFPKFRTSSAGGMIWADASGGRWHDIKEQSNMTSTRSSTMNWLKRTREPGMPC
ncbi:hypothetical protein Egran_05647 [Elaphomyces granulatus]|uniref:Uncharacterized protein n=1 Tax=Elaphomyces granulatus TaxID=519963 RepID=A0A232LQZ5_9EURO|nr:hypothetical protein Egran_05647 [Elaphomyces granulatus]